jgi:LysM repeat protein
MYCRQCGVRLQQGMAICPECGTRQRRRASSVRCAYCHSRVPVDLTVCPHCGRDLRPAGPRWGVWAGGLAALALLVFWGMGRLPVRQVQSQIVSRWERLGDLMRLPAVTPPPRVAELQPGDTPTAPVVALPTTVSVTTPVSATVPITGTAGAAVQTTASAAISLTATLTATAAGGAQGTVTPVSTAAETGFYTVRAGDTLSGIGEETGIPWTLIAALNGMSQYAPLQVGQKLLLPTPTLAPTQTPTQAAISPTPTPQATVKTPTRTPSPTPTSTVRPSPTAVPTATGLPTATPRAAAGTTYRVQPGDTLAGIGARFGIDWQVIAQANGLTGSSTLQVGQQLIIPGANATAAPPSTRAPVATQEGAPAPATPAAAFPAPVLTMPGDNASYSGDTAQIVLQWQVVPDLPSSAQYQIEFRWTGNGVSTTAFERVSASSTGSRVPPWLYLKADQPSRRYSWWVHVIQVTTDGKGGERIIELSPPSETRTFYWN